MYESVDVTIEHVHEILNTRGKYMTLKALPLYDRILVKREDEESVSPGGIVIPGAAQEKPMKGKVVAVGQGKLLQSGNYSKPLLKVGDAIMFGKFAGAEIKVGDDKFVVMREDDVLCVMVDDGIQQHEQFSGCMAI